MVSKSPFELTGTTDDAIRLLRSGKTVREVAKLSGISVKILQALWDELGRQRRFDDQNTPGGRHV